MKKNLLFFYLCFFILGVSVKAYSQNIVPHSVMTVTASSFQPGNEPTLAIDDDPSTFWHTSWDPPSSIPQTLTIDMGSTYHIQDLRYLPRQDGNQNGIIIGYDVLVSNNGTDFWKVTDGWWGLDATEKTAYIYNGGATCRYVMLSAWNGTNNFASAAEINIDLVSAGPPNPTGLTGAPGNGQVTLNWSASEGATSYNVFRGTSSNGESATPIATGITSTSYIDNTGLTNGSTYYYKITATNTNGNSNYSSEISVTPGNLATGKPTTVSSVEGGNTNIGDNAVDASMDTRWASDYTDPSWIYVDLGSSQSISRVVLKWEAAGKVYLIQTSDDATNWTTQFGNANGDGGTDDINFTTVSARYVRMYGIQRTTGWGYSLFDFGVYANANGTIPAAPTGLAATGGNGQVSLSWTASSGATSYSIYRGTASGNETIVASGITETSYVNTDLTNGSTYYYKVTAENWSGNTVTTSLPSNEASASTIASVPLPPTGITPIAGKNQVVLNWTASSGATSYSIFRGTTAGGESETPIANGITEPSYLDAGLTNDVTYYYKIKATNEAGTSEYSEEASVAPSPIVYYYYISCAWFNNGHNGYLYDNNGTNVAYSTLETTDKYRWILEDVGGGYVRIKNKASGLYMNISEGELNVKCSDVPVTDITSHWKVTIDPNTNRIIQNRSNGKYLNIENQLGYAVADMTGVPGGNSLWSAQWVFDSAGGEGIPVTGVSVSPASATIEGYGSQQLTVTIAPENAINKNVTWTSSNPAVATVSATGLVSASDFGNTVITVTTDEGGFTASTNITVAPVAVTGINLVQAELNVFVNKTKSIYAIVSPANATNKVFTWTSSDPSVATVSIHGTVTGIKAGTATITATTKDGSKTASCSVTVTAAGNATPVVDFLHSIGVNTAVSARGEDLTHTVDALKYLGIGFIRYEGNDITSVNSLYQQTGAKTCLLVNQDFGTVINTATQLANAGSLLAIEGPNEPNTWHVNYQGQEGGGDGTWVPVAKYQRDLYTAIKGDDLLKSYPVFMHTDNGAEFDNAGVQFIRIPEGAGTIMPAGTQFADYATIHNYYSHGTYGSLVDNITWRAASDTVKEPNNLFENFGETWKKGYKGYANRDLHLLPRVTTETGITVGTFDVTEDMQGRLQLNCFLSQFKRGFSYTAVYLLRDRMDEGGNQTFGFYKGDYTARPAATYLHNMTTILHDEGSITPGQVYYSISGQPETTHDLLLQKSNGTYDLVVWGERYTSGGSDNIMVNLGAKYANVSVYDPITGTDAVQTLSNEDTLKVSVSDHPVIIEFSGSVAVTGVTVSPVTASMTVGGTQQLTATLAPDNAGNQTISWISSDPTVATVSSTGLVTAVKAGTATITVTTQDGGFTATSAITVNQKPVSGVTVSPAASTITVGETQQLTATVTPDDAGNQNVTWISSDPTVATVSETGLVTAVKAGNTTITVTTQDGSFTATSNIKVKDDATGFDWLHFWNDVLQIRYLSDNSIEIQVNLEGPYIIQIIGMNGRLFKIFKGNHSRTFSLQRSDVSSGIFIVKLISPYVVKSKKVMMR